MNQSDFSDAFHPVLTPSNKSSHKPVFKYKVGDKVYIAKKYHPNRNVRQLYWAETRSVSGHFNQKNRKTKEMDFFIVKHRWLEISSKGYVTPLYQLSKNDRNINSVYEYQIRPFPPTDDV